MHGSLTSSDSASVMIATALEMEVSPKCHVVVSELAIILTHRPMAVNYNSSSRTDAAAWAWQRPRIFDFTSSTR